MTQQERYELVRGFVRDLYRIRHLNFEHVHQFLTACGTSSDPEAIATYLKRLSTMQKGSAAGDERELGTFEGRFTMDLDSAVRGAAGTTPGQWVVDLLNAFWAATNAMMRANIPSVIGDDGKECVTAAIETGPRLAWTDRRDAEYRRAVEHIDREIDRLSALLMVWHNSGESPPETCTFDDSRKSITYLGKPYSLVAEPRSYLYFKTVYQMTYEELAPDVTERQVKERLNRRDSELKFHLLLRPPKLDQSLADLMHSKNGSGWWFAVPAVTETTKKQKGKPGVKKR